MKLVMTTNNAYDTVLLIDKGKIVSTWRVGQASVLEDYLNTGHRPNDWDVQEPSGIRLPTERGERLARIVDYGDACGVNGAIYDERRREFWIRRP